MDWKKFILAVVVSFVVLEGMEFVIHGIWLAPVYQSMPTSWRDFGQMEQKMWIMWAGGLLFATMFVYVYVRGLENKPWLAQGIRYGIIIALLAMIPATLGNYVVFRVPYTLALKWMAAGTVELALLGIVVAYIFKKAPAAG